MSPSTFDISFAKPVRRRATSEDHFSLTEQQAALLADEPARYALQTRVFEALPEVVDVFEAGDEYERLIVVKQGDRGPGRAMTAMQLVFGPFEQRNEASGELHTFGFRVEEISIEDARSAWIDAAKEQGEPMIYDIDPDEIRRLTPALDALQTILEEKRSKYSDVEIVAWGGHRGFCVPFAEDEWAQYCRECEEEYETEEQHAAADVEHDRSGGHYEPDHPEVQA